jgi:hypothetical protein
MGTQIDDSKMNLNLGALRQGGASDTASPAVQRCVRVVDTNFEADRLV